LATAGGVAPGTPILDAAVISAAMSAVPGVASAKLRNASALSVTGDIGISQMGSLLGAGGAGLVTFRQNPAGDGLFAVKIDRNSGKGLLAVLPEDIVGYLGALMAPIATGEVMTKEEYLSLVEMVYGAPISEEIGRAQIKLDIEFPRQVRRVVGGTSEGNRAKLDIPLLDLLVLQSPLTYEVAF
ncbi:MAG: hypothetical protein FWD94_03520, partial [Treponema sp.]|nr:hypothetical protein [Treponema sp.]